MAGPERTFGVTITPGTKLVSAADKSSDYIVANSAMAEICASLSAPAEQTRDLDRLGSGVEKGRAALILQAVELDKVYEEIAHNDLGALNLVKLAERALEQKLADGEWLYPEIEKLRQRLCDTDAGRDPAIRRGVEEMLDVLLSWLALFQDLHDKLLILADQRRQADTGEVLRARPVEGDIDHQALSREFMARFPKIRAALTK